MQQLQATFNRNDIIKRINTVKDQISELKTVIEKLTCEHTNTGMSSNHVDIREREIPSTIREMLSYLEELLSYRNDLVGCIEGHYEDCTIRLVEIDREIDSYSKPKLKPIIEKKEKK